MTLAEASYLTCPCSQLRHRPHPLVPEAVPVLGALFGHVTAVTAALLASLVPLWVYCTHSLGLHTSVVEAAVPWLLSPDLYLAPASLFLPGSVSLTDTDPALFA